MLVKFLLAALSGLFTGLSFNYPVFSVAVWGSLIPLIFAIRKCTFKECIFVGVVFAVLYYGVAIFWIAYVTRLGLFFLLVYLSLYCIVFTLLSNFLLGYPGVLKGEYLVWFWLGKFILLSISKLTPYPDCRFIRCKIYFLLDCYSKYFIMGNSFMF